MTSGPETRHRLFRPSWLGSPTTSTRSASPSCGRSKRQLRREEPSHELRGADRISRPGYAPHGALHSRLARAETGAPRHLYGVLAHREGADGNDVRPEIGRARLLRVRLRLLGFR